MGDDDIETAELAVVYYSCSTPGYVAELHSRNGIDSWDWGEITASVMNDAEDVGCQCTEQGWGTVVVSYDNYDYAIDGPLYYWVDWMTEGYGWRAPWAWAGSSIYTRLYVNSVNGEGYTGNPDAAFTAGDCEAPIEVTPTPIPWEPGEWNPETWPTADASQWIPVGTPEPTEFEYTPALAGDCGDILPAIEISQTILGWQFGFEVPRTEVCLPEYTFNAQLFGVPLGGALLALFAVVGVSAVYGFMRSS
jgi:hypothetical protein